MPTTHTPGPWGIHQDPPNYGERFACIVGRDSETTDPVLIAEMNWHGRHRMSAPDDTLADARLIAAAPDLLAALAGLLAVIHDSDRRRHPVAMRLLSIVSGRPEFEAIDAARAAIAKATGEAT